MTEEQKLEALQRMLQGANVAQVNLGDGYQTFNMGKDEKWQQEPLPEAEVVEAEVEKDYNDTLIRFVFDDTERLKVIRGLQACEDTGQVAAFAKNLWVEEVLEAKVLRSVEFHRAITPPAQIRHLRECSEAGHIQTNTCGISNLSTTTKDSSESFFCPFPNAETRNRHESDTEQTRYRYGYF